MVYNISWKDHMRNDILNGKLPAISLQIKERRIRLSGNCYRHTEEIASKLILWKPKMVIQKEVDIEYHTLII